MAASGDAGQRLGRRVVAGGLLLLAVVVVGAVFRGIIVTLFVLPGPSVGAGRLDRTALIECTRDLEALERDFRQLIADRFARPEPEAPSWRALIEPLEQRRRDVVARCRLEEGPPDGWGRALADATSELEEAFSATGLVWERHRADGALRLQAVERALDRARVELERPDRASAAPE